jgi:hypothetical protein
MNFRYCSKGFRSIAHFGTCYLSLAGAAQKIFRLQNALKNSAILHSKSE